MQQGTEVYVPPVPPAKKKSRAWIWIAVAAVLLVGYAMNQVEEQPGSPLAPVSVPEGDDYTVTPEDVVDVMAASFIEGFCIVYYEIGDYDAALASFTEGYGASETPSAEAVFDEMLSRC